MREFEVPDSDDLPEVDPWWDGMNGGGKPKAKPFPFVLSKDVTFEPKQFLIDGFLGRHETSAWYGPPDAGKSTVVVDAGAHVAAGLAYCGRAIIQGGGPVLYVAAERGAVTKRRIRAWCLDHDLPDIPLAVVDHAVDLRTDRIDADRVIATAQALAALCGVPVIWIIFETLNRVLAGGDENSSKDMGAVIASVDRIYRATAAHCSLVHHVPQDRSDRMRGHGSVLGAVDMTVRITRDEANVVYANVDKANDLVDKPTFAFTFKSVELHRHPDTGVVTTAPVVVPVEGDAPKARPARRDLPDKEELAMRALADLLADEGVAVPPAWNVPTSIKMMVPVERWRHALVSHGHINDNRRRFSELKNKLKRKNLVAERDSLVWLASGVETSART